MTDVEALRDRLVRQRFYDTEADEAFTVIGITARPPLTLLQYDDDVAWDEAPTNFTVNDGTAQQMGLDEHGLDSERYRQLGAGPRLDGICDRGEHKWNPKPDEIWAGIPSDELRKQMPSHPKDFYGEIARCKRCGLSGSAVVQFAAHTLPWFCHECEDVYQGDELHLMHDVWYCSECKDNVQENPHEE